MRVPAARCGVTASCDVLPTEDPGRVGAALLNVLPGSDVLLDGGRASASAEGPSFLAPLAEAIRSRGTGRAYLRRMRKNMDGAETWFYLNKQAAFAGRVALCSEADESPLGPITVTLRSPRVEEIAEWLGGGAAQENSSRAVQKF